MADLSAVRQPTASQRWLALLDVPAQPWTEHDEDAYREVQQRAERDLDELNAHRAA
jgi:hypothetical protein